MKPFEKFLATASILRELLDIYLELRQHLQELGFSESDLESPPTYTMKMMNLQERFQNKLNKVIASVKDYGFDVTKKEVQDYVMPLLQKINELTPLKDWKLYDSKRDDSGNEDY
jgi:vacuolar-type H+-ATPase catalytic subunit A/Vma1